MKKTIKIAHIDPQDYRIQLSSKSRGLIKWGQFKPQWKKNHLLALYDQSSKKYHTLNEDGTFSSYNKDTYEKKANNGKLLPIARKYYSEKNYYLNLYTPIDPRGQAYEITERTTAKILKSSFEPTPTEITPEPDLVGTLMNASRQIIINHETVDKQPTENDFQRNQVSIDDAFRNELAEINPSVTYEQAVKEFIQSKNMDENFIELLQKPNFQAQVFGATFTAYHVKNTGLSVMQQLLSVNISKTATDNKTHIDVQHFFLVYRQKFKNNQTINQILTTKGIVEIPIQDSQAIIQEICDSIQDDLRKGPKALIEMTPNELSEIFSEKISQDSRLSKFFPPGAKVIFEKNSMVFDMDKEGKMELKDFSIDTELNLLHNQKFKDTVKEFYNLHDNDDLFEYVFKALDKGFLENNSNDSLLDVCAKNGNMSLFLDLAVHQLNIERKKIIEIKNEIEMESKPTLLLYIREGIKIIIRTFYPTIYLKYLKILDPIKHLEQSLHEKLEKLKTKISGNLETLKDNMAVKEKVFFHEELKTLKDSIDIELDHLDDKITKQENVIINKKLGIPNDKILDLNIIKQIHDSIKTKSDHKLKMTTPIKEISHTVKLRKKKKIKGEIESENNNCLPRTHRYINKALSKKLNQNDKSLKMLERNLNKIKKSEIYTYNKETIAKVFILQGTEWIKNPSIKAMFEELKEDGTLSRVEEKLSSRSTLKDNIKIDAMRAQKMQKLTDITETDDVEEQKKNKS